MKIMKASPTFQRMARDHEKTIQDMSLGSLNTRIGMYESFKKNAATEGFVGKTYSLNHQQYTFDTPA